MTTQAGLREIEILTKLNEADIYDKKHTLRLLGNFYHKGHLCIVFELLDLNLRDTLTLYGKRVGLSLPAVRSYAYQLFIALYHLRKNNIVHLDSRDRSLSKARQLDDQSEQKEIEIDRFRKRHVHRRRPTHCRSSCSLL